MLETKKRRKSKFGAVELDVLLGLLAEQVPRAFERVLVTDHDDDVAERENAIRSGDRGRAFVLDAADHETEILVQAQHLGDAAARHAGVLDHKVAY